MPGKRWTENEVRILVNLWGVLAVQTIGRRIGRSVAAILNKAQELQLGRASRGNKSLNQLCRETGYNTRQIRYAMLNLGLVLQYTPDTGRPGAKRNYRHHAITFEQEEVVLEYLARHPDGERVYCTAPGHRTKMGVWGVGNKPPACLGCQSTNRPHRGHGLCGPCHRASLRRKKAGEPVSPSP